MAAPTSPRRRSSSASGTSARSSRASTSMHDDVAVLQQRERAAVECLGRHVADHEAVRRARESAVRDERDRLREPLADDGGGDVQHLAHPRPAGRPLVADDDDVAGQDRAGLDGGEARLLGVEDARGAAVHEPVVARELDDGALRRQVAVQDAQAAGRLDRPLERQHDLLAGPFLDRGRDACERAAVHVRRRAVHERPALEQLAGQEPVAAGLVQVGGDVLAAGLEAREHRRPRRDTVEVVQRVRHAGLTRDREQVQDAVRRAGARRDRGGRVVERCAADDLRRPDVVAHELHRQPARLAGGLLLRVVEGGNRVEPARRDAEELERHRHRVRGELPAAGAGAGTGHALERVHVRAASSTPAACCPTASKTSWIVTSRPR